jgi:hypothetical protein
MGRLRKRQITGAVNVAKKKQIKPDNDFYNVTESLGDGDSTTDIVSDNYDVLITAVSNIIHKPRRIYYKNSRTTKWRRKKDSAGSLKINSFFHPATNTNCDEQSEDINNDADNELESTYCEENEQEEEEDNLIILPSHDLSHHTTLHVDGNISNTAGQQKHFTQKKLNISMEFESGVNDVNKDIPGWQLFNNASAIKAEVTDSSDDDLHSSTSDEVSEQEQHLQNLSNQIQSLAAHLAKVKHTNRISCFQYMQYMSILRYLKLVHEEGVQRLVASKIVANALIQWDAGVEWKAKTIRRWSTHWCRYGELSQSCRGKHQKTKSYIEDEDVQQKCLEWIRFQRGEITSRFLTLFIFFYSAYIYLKKNNN